MDNDEEVPFFEDASDEETMLPSPDQDKPSQGTVKHYTIDPSEERPRRPPTKKQRCRFRRSQRARGILCYSTEGFTFDFPAIPPRFGRIVWKKEFGYCECDCILPKKFMKYFSDVKYSPGVFSSEDRNFFHNKLLGYPLYEGNFGKYGTTTNSLTLRREGTHRQSHWWVFDKSQLGLNSQPFIYCATDWVPEVRALLNSSGDRSPEESKSRYDRLAEAMSKSSNLIDYSGIAQTLAFSGFKADVVEFTFSSHFFKDSQGVLTRKEGAAGVFGKYYYISDTGTDWHFDLSLHMFYKKYPRNLFFCVSPR